MNATINFTLPEDQAEHRLAIHAGDMASAICHHMETTRSWLKHGHSFRTPDEAIEACRALLSDVADVARGDV